MLRALHILLNSLTLLSLLLCLAAAALWIRGLWAADAIVAGFWDYRPHPRYPAYKDASFLLAVHERGRCTFSIVKRACVEGPGRHLQTGPGPNGEKFAYQRADSDGLMKLAPAGPGVQVSDIYFGGFGYREAAYFKSTAIPDWSLVTATILLPAARLLKRRLRNPLPGMCQKCGYDLRATPNRCPECGTIPSFKS